MKEWGEVRKMYSIFLFIFGNHLDFCNIFIQFVLPRNGSSTIVFEENVFISISRKRDILKHKL